MPCQSKVLPKSSSFLSDPARTLWFMAMKATFTWRIMIYFGDHMRSTRFHHLWWCFGENTDHYLLCRWAHHWFEPAFLMHCIFTFIMRMIWQLPIEILTFCAFIAIIWWHSEHATSCTCLILSLFCDDAGHMLCKLSSNHSHSICDASQTTWPRTFLHHPSSEASATFPPSFFLNARKC
jgi:hypothetical protein